MNPPKLSKQPTHSMPEKLIPLDRSSVCTTTSGALHGKVHFKFPDKCFPDEGWTDFLVIFAEWHRSVSLLLTGTFKQAVLPFMEGPYVLVADILTDGMISITASKRTRDGMRNGCTLSIPILQMLEEVADNCRDILATCEERKIKSRDLEALRTAVEAHEYRSAAQTKGKALSKPLSPQELRVFEMIGRGLDAQQIARQLGISRSTVDGYTARIREKMGLASSSELQKEAVKWKMK